MVIQIIERVIEFEYSPERAPKGSKLRIEILLVPYYGEGRTVYVEISIDGNSTTGKTPMLLDEMKQFYDIDIAWNKEEMDKKLKTTWQAAETILFQQVICCLNCRKAGNRTMIPGTIQHPFMHPAGMRPGQTV